MKTLYRNATIVNEGRMFGGYIVTDGPLIAAVGEGEPSETSGFDTVTDLGGAMLVPGAIDTHVHFREPGLTHKGSIATESAAAVAGGVTSFLDMPNTVPQTVTVQTVEEKKRIAAASAHANYGFFIGATDSNIDALLRADRSLIPGIKLFLGSSTGNMLVSDDDAIRRLFASFPGVIAVHAEDEATIAEAKKRIIGQFGDDAPVSLHSELRSAEACLRSTQRIVEIARQTGGRLHVLHISTAAELQFFSEGPVEDKKITAETCPHYLLFTSEMLSDEDGCFKKCNPAIKTDADRRALIKAVVDGKIDTIATDHAPHTRAEKQGTLFRAASGMPGVKFMLPALMSLTVGVDAPFTPMLIVEKCCHNPATVYGIDRRGYLRPGYFADFTVLERTEPYTVSHTDADSHLGDGHAPTPDWTPYAGTVLHHRVALTVVNGSVAFDGGRVRQERSAMPLKFN